MSAPEGLRVGARRRPRQIPVGTGGWRPDVRRPGTTGELGAQTRRSLFALPLPTGGSWSYRACPGVQPVGSPVVVSGPWDPGVRCPGTWSVRWRECSWWVPPRFMMYVGGRVGGRCSLLLSFLRPPLRGGSTACFRRSEERGGRRREPRSGGADWWSIGPARGGYIAKARSGLTGPLRAFIVLASSAPLMWYRAVTRPERPSFPRHPGPDGPNASGVPVPGTDD